MSQSAPRDLRAGLASTRRAALAPESPPTPAPATAHAATNEPPTPAPRRRSRWLVWASLFGPGIISAAAGNDAGGIFTFSQAGARYGFSLLWTLVVVTIGLIVVQEMCARMAAVTGKGLADLIRENFGVRVTLFAMTVLVVANFAITVSEFAGIAAVGEMFLGSKARFSIVPIIVVLVWLLVSRGSYQKIERIFLVASLVFLVYIVAALKIGVSWSDVLATGLAPSSVRHWDAGTVGMAVALIGTTISPYMQFYQQAAVRDKGVNVENYRLAKWDTVIGCILASLVAVFIVITCAETLHTTAGGATLNDASDVARALRPLAGEYAEILFAFGLLNASLMAAVVVPLSTSFAVTEALGWEAGLGRRIRESPLFYGTYGALILLSGLLIMAFPPQSNLIDMVIGAQKLNCALLPVELVLMLILINRRRLMGHYRNGFWMNFAGWTITVIAGGLSLLNLVWRG